MSNKENFDEFEVKRTYEETPPQKLNEGRDENQEEKIMRDSLIFLRPFYWFKYHWDHSLKYHNPRGAKLMTMKNFTKEVSEIHQGQGDMLNGLNIMCVRPFYADPYMSAALVHSVALQPHMSMQGQTIDPSEYSCSCQMNQKGVTMTTRIDGHKILYMNGSMDVHEKLKTSFSFNNFEERMSTTLAYKDKEKKTYDLRVDWKDNKVILGHTKPITKYTQLGIQQTFNAGSKSRETSFRGSARYHKDNLTLNSDLFIYGDGLEDKKKFKFGYAKKYKSFKLGGEITYNPSDRKSNWWYGVKKDYLNGASHGFNITDDFTIRTAWEKPMGKSVLLMATTESDVFKNEHKIGVGIQYQYQGGPGEE